MHSPLTFDRPLWLLLLPLAAWYFIHTTRGSQAALPPRTRPLALGLRLAVAALLIFALAMPRVLHRANQQTVLFLLDISQSIRPDQRARALAYVNNAIAHKARGDRAGIIVFGQTPSLALSPTPSPDVSHLNSDAPAEATDLAAALRLAESAFPTDTARKVVILSDGNETRGAAITEADTLRLAGVRVDIAPTGLDLARSTSPEALVDSVTAPAESPANAPLPVQIALSSTVPQKGDLTVTRDGHVFFHQSVSLAAGRTDIAVTDQLSQPGLHHYAAELRPAQDNLTQNNHGGADVFVRGRPHVLYVTDNLSTSALPRILAAQGMVVTAVLPGAVPADPARLVAYDGIVLSDVPASEFSPAQMTAMGVSVRTFGIGLGMVGGPNSFGAGQWAGTPIETALPVKMDVPHPRQMPPAAVVVVLDASGSMSKTEDGVEKVQLGARAAVQLMQSLQSADEVAVTSVTTASTIVVPLQPARNVAQARRLIEDVHAGGGGIYCRQGLEDAYALLTASHAPLKHVILVADTTDSEQPENCVALAAYMRKTYHISTTVCGIGQASDPDAAFQQSVAKAGGGQWAAVAAAADLPQLFRRDVQTLQRSWYTEIPTLALADREDDALAGLAFSTAPALLGHNLVTARPGANVALRSTTQDPLFVHAQSGLGRAFAFTADDRPHWSAHWLAWPENARFWTQAVRAVLRGPQSAAFAATLVTEGGHAKLTIDAAPSLAPPIIATAVAPDGTSHVLALAATAPGRAEATFDSDQPGTYLVSVHQTGPQGGAKLLRLLVPYAPEYRTLGPNLPLLMALADSTGGRLQPDPARIYADRADLALGATLLTPALLGIAAFCFIADIAARRLSVTLPAVRLALRAAPRTARRAVAHLDNAAFPRPAPVPAPQVETLLTRRVQSRAPDETASEDANPFPQVATLHPRPPSRRREDD